jgi:hypothetical protein
MHITQKFEQSVINVVLTYDKKLAAIIGKSIFQKLADNARNLKHK